MIRYVNTISWGILATIGLTSASADGGPNYFSPRTFALDPLPSGRRDISGMLAKRFATALQKMREPSLWEKARMKRRLDAYRILWLPGFDAVDRPVAVRVEKADRRVMLTVVQLGRDGEEDAGKVVLSKQVHLDRSRWNRLAARIWGAGFWDMPARIDYMGYDGEEFVVEGVRDGEYHAVYRWTPKPGAYRELCREMLNLTGMDLGQRHWPAPPPYRAALRVAVGLALCLVAVFCLYAVLWWPPRSKKPRPLKSLEELA